MIRIGTSGYSFPHWVGAFYPRDLRKGDWLEFYAQRFPIVEINSTYYGIPHPKVFREMEKKTPAEFEFLVKLHASQTHTRESVPETLAATDYGWSSFIVIATRGHKLDADCVLAAVKTKARYIGLLGSRRKTILIEEMLKEHGIADDRVKAIHAPVGLDLGGRTPAEIALSVLAEITQVRYQGTGRQLSSRN